MKTILLQYTVEINGSPVSGFTIDNSTDFEDFYNACFNKLEFDWFVENSPIVDNPDYKCEYPTDYFKIKILNNGDPVGGDTGTTFGKNKCSGYNWLWLWKVIRNSIENYERGGDSN